MVAVWIVGVLFLIIGLIFSIPVFAKIFKCKGHVAGKIISIDHSDKNSRAIYEYTVAGHKYTNKTNWTSNCIFRVGGECHVIYHEENPEYSYIKWSGQAVRGFVGAFFAVIGIGVLLLGIFLQRVVL